MPQCCVATASQPPSSHGQNRYIHIQKSFTHKGQGTTAPSASSASLYSYGKAHWMLMCRSLAASSHNPAALRGGRCVTATQPPSRQQAPPSAAYTASSLFDQDAVIPGPEMLQLLPQLVDLGKGLLPFWHLCAVLQQSLGPIAAAHHPLHGLHALPALKLVHLLCGSSKPEHVRALLAGQYFRQSAQGIASYRGCSQQQDSSSSSSSSMTQVLRSFRVLARILAGNIAARQQISGPRTLNPGDRLASYLQLALELAAVPLAFLVVALSLLLDR